MEIKVPGLQNSLPAPTSYSQLEARKVPSLDRDYRGTTGRADHHLEGPGGRNWHESVVYTKLFSTFKQMPDSDTKFSTKVHTYKPFELG